MAIWPLGIQTHIIFTGQNLKENIKTKNKETNKQKTPKTSGVRRGGRSVFCFLKDPGIFLSIVLIILTWITCHF